MARQITAGNINDFSALGDDYSVDSSAVTAAVPMGSFSNFNYEQQQQQQRLQDPYFGGNYNVNGRAQNSNNANVSEMMNGALKERIIALEKQVSTLNNSIVRKDEEFHKLEDRLRKVNVDFDNSRKNNARVIQQLKEDHERELIRLREQHAHEMSFIAAVGPEDVSKPPQGRANAPSSPKKNATDPSFEANKNLIEQIDVLRNEHRRLQDKYAEERRALQVDSNAKILAQERQYKAELLEIRAKYAELEDVISQRDEELAAARGRAEALNNLNKQLEKAKYDSLEAQNRLRSELKSMQQSVATSYRLETTQGLSLGADPETAIKLNEAKTEAKVRQMTNKVEFLKAQLETEQKTSEDLRRALDVSKTKLEELRDEFRIRMHEAEKQRKDAIEATEQRVESVYEERMVEFTSLQSKYLMLQSQLQDTVQVTSQNL